MRQTIHAGARAVRAIPGPVRRRAADAAVLAVRGARSMWRRGVNYARTLTWLLHCGVERRMWRAVSAFAFGQISLGAQVAALGVLYWYAGRAQADAVVSLPLVGISWGARDSLSLVLIVVAGSAGCFLASCGFRYLSRNLVVGLGERMLAERLTEIVRVARRLPDPRAPAASQVFVAHGLKSISRAGRYAAVSVVTLLEALTPIVGGVGAAVALLVIDPLLTTMLVAAAGCWCIAIYPLMTRQMQVQSRMLREKTAFAHESAAMLQAPPGTAVPARLASAVALAQVAVGRRRLTNGIAGVLESGNAVIGALAALYLASRLIAGDGDWPIFILYLGGLRVALSGGFAAPQAFGVVSRYYPDLVVFVEFMQDAARMDALPVARVAAGEAVRLGTLPDGGVVRARGGDRVALVSSDASARVAGTFLGARAADQPVAAAWRRPAGGPADAGADPASDDVAIRLVEAEALAVGAVEDAGAWIDAWRDGVTVIVHRGPERVGAFGESQLLVTSAGAIVAAAPVGTDAGRTALAAVAAELAEAGPDAPRVGAPGLADAEDDA